MKRHVENLLNQLKRSLAHLKHSGGDDLQDANNDFGLVEGLKRFVLQIVQINTNSLSRDTRADIRSAVVEAALFILRPEEIEIVQKAESQRIKLCEELAGASTRSARSEPIAKLRWLDEQQILFIRGVLKNDQKKHGKSKLKRKRYFKLKRALGIGTQENTSDAQLLTDRWRKASS
jgi:hypothetical protein